jgi:hypothetical protein
MNPQKLRRELQDLELRRPFEEEIWGGDVWSGLDLSFPGAIYNGQLGGSQRRGDSTRANDDVHHIQVRRKRQECWQENSRGKLCKGLYYELC